MQFQPNTLFHDHYTLVRLIGRGGFSEVWLAQDKYTGLDLALKIYAPNGGLDSDGIEAFAGEIRRVYNLNHPNLLKPQHFDVCDGMPYLVMPYCANGSVTKRAGHISEDEIWKVLHDVAAGLAYLHEHNIVHQDIKPDNILQAADGHYLITDFGISARTRATLSKTQSMNNIGSGTAAYMAPERFSTNPAPTFASDVWALGDTLYELIAGSVPFGDGTLPGGLLQKNGAEMSSLPASISNSLREVIEKSVSVNPWDRPSAKDLVDGNFSMSTLERNRSMVTISTSHPAPCPVIEDTARKEPYSNNGETTNGKKKKIEWIIICLLLLALVVGIGVYVYNSVGEQIPSVSAVPCDTAEIANDIQDVIDKNRVETVITEISRCSSRGGNYSLLSNYYTYEINPYSKAGENRYNYSIGEKTKAYVERFPKYEISDPYNFSYLNASFPLTVKCDVKVEWINMKGTPKQAVIHKTYYITADYKVSGFFDEQVETKTAQVKTEQKHQVEKQNNDENFVTGVSSYILYSPAKDEYNNGAKYSYQGRNIKVSIFYYQIGVVARLTDEGGNQTDIKYEDPFTIGEVDRYSAENYKNMEYIITQYDFDGDNIDEIVIASRIKDGASFPVGIFIYRLRDCRHWNLLAPQTWWGPKVHLQSNHIRVDANHSGFEYHWVYENNNFVDRGNY